MEGFFLSQIPINLFLQNLGDAVIGIARLFTSLGDEIFYFLFMPFLYWCVDSAMGLRIGAMLMLSNSINSAVKMLFHWPRPFWVNGSVVNYVDESSFGFPSGHSANAASVWGVMAAHIRRKWVWIAVICVVFLIGVSRLVLGVHFLVDVLGGWALGILMAVLFIRFEQPVTAWFNRLNERQQWVMAVISSILLILPVYLLSWLFSGAQFPPEWAVNAGAPLDPFNPEGAFTSGGTWAGFLCGVVWFRRRCGRLSMDVRLLTRLLRFVVGIIGTILFWRGLDMLFPATRDGLGLSLRYVRYFLTGFWIAGLAPYLFTKVTDSLFQKPSGTLKKPRNPLQ